MDDEAKHLSSFINTVCEQSHLRVETDYGDGFVRLRSDEAERRQAAHDIRSTEDVVIELLRNARDAEARHIYLAMSMDGRVRKVTVIDDGVGVPEAMQKLVFEPRVTSKLDTVHMDKWGVHGRGMALYSVSMNTQRAEIVQSSAGMGTSIAVESDTDKLHEKADQSTFPTIVVSDGTRATLRGPHNIFRTAAEFALEHRRTLSVYVGSPVEIANSLYWRGCSVTSATMRSFSPDVEGVSLVKRPCYARDERQLAEICASLGLELSTRTARRIMDGQIGDIESLVERIERQLQPSGESPARSPKQQKAGSGAVSPLEQLQGASHANACIRISDSELKGFAEGVADSFGELARAYYLDPGVEATAKVTQGILRISIPLVPLE